MSSRFSDDLYLYPNRTICSILEDMRAMRKTHNYSQLEACIEELQYAANRMESALSDMKDIRSIKDKLEKMKAEYRKEIAKQFKKKED